MKKDLSAKPQVAASISSWLELQIHHRIHGSQWQPITQPAGVRGPIVHGAARGSVFQFLAVRKHLFQQSMFSLGIAKGLEKDKNSNPFEEQLLPPSRRGLRNVKNQYLYTN